MITMLTLLVGAAGAVTRFLVDADVKRRWPTTFPWATFVRRLPPGPIRSANASASAGCQPGSGSLDTR